MHTVEVLVVLAALASHGPSVKHDARQLWRPASATPALLGGASATVAHATRDDWHDPLSRGWLERPSDLTDLYGFSGFNLPVALGLHAAGSLLHRPGLRDLGDGLTRALVLTQLVVGPMKLASGRRRPDGSNRLSFPSGHAANTFAIARLLQRRNGNGFAAPFYALATATGVGRLEGNRHYLSDVLVGAAVGVIVGNAVGVDDDPGPVTVLPVGGGLRLRVELP